MCLWPYLSKDEIPVGLCRRQFRMSDVRLARGQQHHGVLLEDGARRCQIVSHCGIFQLVLSLCGLVHEVLRRDAESLHTLHKLGLGADRFELERNEKN